MLGYWSVLPAASWTMKCKNQWQVCTSLHTDTHVVGYYTFVILVLLCQIDHLENQEAEKNLGIDNCRILNGTVRRIIRLICFHFHFDYFVPRMRMLSCATVLSSTVTNRGFKLMMNGPNKPSWFIILDTIVNILTFYFIHLLNEILIQHFPFYLFLFPFFLSHPSYRQSVGDSKVLQIMKIRKC